MADDLHITRAFNLLQEATVLLSGNIESSSGVNENANDRRVSSTVTSNTSNSISTPTSANVSLTLSTNSTTQSSSNEPRNSTTQSSSNEPRPHLTPTNTQTTVQQNVLRNFQSLFSPYSRSNSQRLGRNTGSMPIRNNRRSRQQSATTSRALKEETWTHDVFCLASAIDLVTPNREKKGVLQAAGLGRKKIRFNAKGTPQAFKETLELSFPKLICGGGFDLLRRSVSGNQLDLIQPPAAGYSVAFVKSCGIGQAILYVRPIQCDLDTTPEVEEPGSEISAEDAENAPKVSCMICGARVPITVIRDHQQDCMGNEDFTVGEEVTGPSCSDTSANVDDIRVSLLLPSLRDIFPNETEDILRRALRRSNFDLAGATEIVLNPGLRTADSSDVESGSDLEELLDRPLIQIRTSKKFESDNKHLEHYDIRKQIESFRESKIDNEAPRQLFTVCREDGEAVMKADIIGMYKNPRTNLLARPRVRFEGEEGVGAGPLREFLQVAVKIAEDGIGFSTKPVIYFEGEPDYKLPVHNPSLRNTGSFRAVGRILAHSFLHGGPGIHGLSKAVKHYFASEKKQDLSSDPPPLELQDVPDFDLRMLLKEILDFPPDEKLSDETVSNIMPYLLEAGVDTELLYSSRQIVCQCLLMHNVIEKRKIELDDILIGMEVVGLKTFIEKYPQSVQLIFPSQNVALIDVNEMKSKILFQEDDGSDIHNAVREMFLQYIDVIDSRMEVGAQLQDLCCFWTGWNVLPPRSEKLNVMFDKTSSIELPMAECCFNNLILPVLHTTLEDFKKKMDIAIKHGSKGFTFS